MIPLRVITPLAVVAGAVSVLYAAQPAVDAGVVAKLAPLVVDKDIAPEGLAAAMVDVRVDAIVRIMKGGLDAPLPGVLGGPQTGLRWRQYVDFYDGRLAFARKYSAEDGLGPVYNDDSCGACHVAPALGGGGTDMRHGITVHGPKETGGDAMGVRKYAIPGHAKEKPEGKIARLRTPPLFGLGLLDTIPDATIDANVDPDDNDGDGIKGLRGVRWGPNRKRGTTRFGQKANEWNLEKFVAGAFFDEMGITSFVRRMPVQDHDGLKDPEGSRADVARLVAFVRYLGAPARGKIDPTVKRGETAFHTLGCTGCHRPSLGKVNGAYTDLLLHDMGEKLDSGIKDGLATGSHWRTAPLWGLRHRARYLHDERAADFDAVLGNHLGEAKRASDAYRKLSAASRADLHAFLKSL